MHYRRLLAVVELVPWSEAAVREGISLAAALRAELILFSPIPPPPSLGIDAMGLMAESGEGHTELLNKEARQRLKQAGQQAEAAGVMHHALVHRSNDVVSDVLAQAQHWRCQAILVGTPEQNAVMRLLTGNLIPALITASTVPVIVCKPHEPSDGS